MPENNTIKIALVGSGARGTGAAANALQTAGPTSLWAMADVFGHRLDSSLKSLSEQFPKQVEVSPERRFIGFDAYKKAMTTLDKGDVVLLATPPAFRPMHFEYAAAGPKGTGRWQLRGWPDARCARRLTLRPLRR